MLRDSHRLLGLAVGPLNFFSTDTSGFHATRCRCTFWTSRDEHQLASIGMDSCSLDSCWAMLAFLLQNFEAVVAGSECSWILELIDPLLVLDQTC